MTQQKAIEVATAANEQYPTAKKLFVCTDETVFAEPALATAHAVTLSTGNPEVFEVEMEVKQVLVVTLPVCKEKGTEAKTAEADGVEKEAVKGVVVEVLLNALNKTVAAPIDEVKKVTEKPAVSAPVGEAESFGNASAVVKAPVKKGK